MRAAEELDGLLGLLDLLDLVADDEGNLGDLVDDMTAGHHQRRNAGRSERRADSVALLGDVHLAVPASVHLRRREHATTAAHVAERTLARAVGTTTTDTGNTRHGTASTPRFSRRLMACKSATFALCSFFRHLGEYYSSTC